MRLCLYLVGYEANDFAKLWANLLVWVGLWPFIFPGEEFHWHVLMLTEGEYLAYEPYWNPGGTPRWNSIDARLHPSVKVFTHLCNVAGVFLVTRVGPEGVPGRFWQPLTGPDAMLPPEVFWHEALCHSLNPSSYQDDYFTVHNDGAYHCGTPPFYVAGACPQSGGRGTGVCHSTPCVRCRACFSKFTGLPVNFTQTPEEHEWFKARFRRWYKCYQYADMDAQSAAVESYDYAKYPLSYWVWDHDLAWYKAQPQDSNRGKIHIHLERVLGGDGTPQRIATAADPAGLYVFDPLTYTVRERGFLETEPADPVGGEPMLFRAYSLDIDNVKVDIANIQVTDHHQVVRATGPDGRTPQFNAD